MSRPDVPLEDVGPGAPPGTADVTVGIPTYNRSDLLRAAIASVLAQSYPHFTLIVSDNASDDDTADVVRSFDDSRVVYRPLDENIGRTANFNRLVGLAETEYVLVLGDDDELHPDHLSLALDALKRFPRVGVSHTGYTILDGHGNTLNPYPDNGAPAVIETGARVIERSMREPPSLHISTAIFRKAAFDNTGGLREEDGVIDDFPLTMRIATAWDFAYLSTPLAMMRAHDGASSASLGEFTPRGFRSSRSLPEVLYQHRLRFLADANLPAADARRLRGLTERSHRRDVLSHLSMRAITGDGIATSFGALRREIRRDLRFAFDPLTWRFIAGSLGGRRVRDHVRSALASAHRRQ